MIRLAGEWKRQFEQYERRHAAPLDRVLREFGVPLVALSLPAWLFGVRAPLALSVLLAGWLLQCAGDWSTGRSPRILRDVRNLVIAPIWWLRNRGVPIGKLQEAENETGGRGDK